MKYTQNWSSKVWWCIKSTDTYSKCVWGRSWAGGTGQKCQGAEVLMGVHGEGSKGHVPHCCDPAQAGGSGDLACDLRPRPNPTLSAAFLTSTNCSPGTIPIPKGKSLRRYHFVPPSIYVFRGRTALSTA